MLKNSSHFRFYLLAFIEGGNVMACELLGAKLLSPFFGNSLYVWSSVLAITLGGLMGGYFLGGHFSKRADENEKFLFWALSLAGLLMIIMPVSGKWIMGETLYLPLQWASVLSLLVFMFPSLFLMGMTSPLIINILTDSAKRAGNYAGNVYAISTLGGILFTFGMGFYLIPAFGILWPSFFCGVLLLVGALLLIKYAFKPKIVVFMVGAIICIWVLTSFTLKSNNQGEILQYQSEGLLGQIKIMDLPAEKEGNIQTYRCLFVNNTLQTILNLDNPEMMFFSHLENIPQLLKSNINSGSVLILGMGGGILASSLARDGWAVDAVEIDSRLKKIASGYFNLSDQVNVIVDDARHVLNTMDKKYDAIIFDLFYGEVTPEHVMTKEAFDQCKSLLNDQGILLFNLFGDLTVTQDTYGKAVLKTLLESQFEIKVILSKNKMEDQSILFLASNNAQRISKLEFSNSQLLNLEDIKLENTLILRDDYQYPKISIILTKEWKGWYNNVTSNIFESHTCK